jgi:hypothetical protein
MPPTEPYFEPDESRSNPPMHEFECREVNVKKNIINSKRGRVLLELTDVHSKVMTANHTHPAHIKIIRIELLS